MSSYPSWDWNGLDLKYKLAYSLAVLDVSKFDFVTRPLTVRAVVVLHKKESGCPFGKVIMSLWILGEHGRNKLWFANLLLQNKKNVIRIVARLDHSVPRKGARDLQQGKLGRKLFHQMRFLNTVHLNVFTLQVSNSATVLLQHCSIISAWSGCESMESQRTGMRLGIENSKKMLR